MQIIVVLFTESEFGGGHHALRSSNGLDPVRDFRGLRATSSLGTAETLASKLFAVWSGPVSTSVRLVPWRGRERTRPNSNRAQNSPARPYYPHKTPRWKIPLRLRYFSPARRYASAFSWFVRYAGMGSYLQIYRQGQQASCPQTGQEPFGLPQVLAGQVSRTANSAERHDLAVYSMEG